MNWSTKPRFLVPQLLLGIKGRGQAPRINSRPNFGRNHEDLSLFTFTVPVYRILVFSTRRAHGRGVGG